MTSDELYMRRCLQLAALGGGWTAPNPMVGAVIVSADNRIIGEGYHHKFGGAHAEVEAFKSVKTPDEIGLSAATLYVSLEPCSHYGKTPPCADLIIRKGVKRVVCGMLDPNPLVAGKGVQKLKDAGIEVVVGVLEKECRELNKRFLCLQEQHRPYIILKWAQTADGFIDKKRDIPSHAKAQRREKPLAISNILTKQIVHKMRAENMAIMVGTNTVLLDDPRLLVTHWTGRNPIRITIDRHKKLPMKSRIFSDDAPTIVYRERTDWEYIVQDLAARQIHSVLIEGGTALLNHILETGIWDEMHIEVGPMMIEDGVPAPKVKLPTQANEIVQGNSLYLIKNLSKDL